MSQQRPASVSHHQDSGCFSRPCIAWVRRCTRLLEHPVGWATWRMRCLALSQKALKTDTVAGILDSTWTWQVSTFIRPAPTVFPGAATRVGPGAAVPDPTQGLGDVKDLPAPPPGFDRRSHA